MKNCYFVRGNADLSKVRLTAKGANEIQRIDGIDCEVFGFQKDGVQLIGIKPITQPKAPKTPRKAVKR